MNYNNLINRIKQINSNIKFVGEFDNNNQRTGYWEEYWDNGDLETKGNYINGLRNGYWENYYVNGIINSKGNYLNGKRNGYWEDYYYDGDIVSKRNYFNGKFYEIE